MSTSAHGPVSAALYTALNVAGMTAIATGGVYDWAGVPSAVSYPFLAFMVHELPGKRLIGTGKRCEVTVQAFAQPGGSVGPVLQVNNIIAKAVELLEFQAITVTGFDSCLITYEGSNPPGLEEINGITTVRKAGRFAWVVQES